MPIYEYRCGECGDKFEKWVRTLSCQDDVQCPKCGSKRVQKAVSRLGTGGSSSSVFADSSCAPTGG